MTRPLQDRIALVTGGSSGIGAACALALAAAGADVMIVYGDDEDGATTVAKQVHAAGGSSAVFSADIGQRDAVNATFDAIGGVFGPPDILVNAAGLNMRGVDVADMDPDDWDRLIRTDLTGSFLTSRRFVQDLRGEQRPGAIVNVTSIHAFAMRAGGADYAAAKGGQTNLTRTMALECAPFGITVNAIAPGMILTPMNQEVADDPEKLAQAVASIPCKRAGRPEEVARLAVYLVSPDASYITGTTIVIDGGLSLQLGQGA